MRTEAYGHFNATQAVLVHDRLERHASQVEAMGGQLNGAVSRVRANVEELAGDTTYLRTMAEEAAAYREEQYQRNERNFAMVLEALRGGARELRLLFVQDVQEIQAENKTLMMNSIIDSQSESLRYHFEPATRLLYRTHIARLTDTAFSQSERQSTTS